MHHWVDGTGETQGGPRFVRLEAKAASNPGPNVVEELEAPSAALRTSLPLQTSGSGALHLGRMEGCAQIHYEIAELGLDLAEGLT